MFLKSRSSGLKIESFNWSQMPKLRDFSGVFNLPFKFKFLHKLVSFSIVLSKIYLIKPSMLISV